MLILVLSGMILIVLSADYFTNGVEWLGRGLGIGESAVGTLLAALGTALPETLVPVLAIVTGESEGRMGVGLGAILGAPFMLATLGFAILGAGTWWFGRPRPPDVPRAVGRDLRFFLAAFSGALIVSLMPGAVRPFLGGALVVFYLGFAWHVLRSAPAGDGGGRSTPLHFWHDGRPPMLVAAGQVALGLAGLVVGAHFFVQAITDIAVRSGMSGFVLSVLLTPVATELPEVLNSVIWLRRRQDVLAYGNVTGAMAFQASLVPALGIWLTPWRFSGLEWAVGALALSAALWALVIERRRYGVKSLMGGGAAYLLAAAGLLAGAVHL